ncbi:MAG TPA: VWA domain-containing protein [Candidatus Tectomicrobia bacterium]|nr:VWA domain-containing protein [Candidatus Tectomicrobia bacterium]
MNLTFITPQYLLLLGFIPIIVWLFWRSTTHLMPFRRSLVLILRVLMAALVVLALSGLSVENPTEQVNVMFALDASDSVGAEGREAALDFVQRALKQMKKGDQAGLIVFGEDASVELALQPDATVPKIDSTVSGRGTDLAHAIDVALAQFPITGKKRIMLLTDGNETQGNAQEVALVAQSLGVEMWSVPVGNNQRPMDVKLDRILVPPRMNISEPFDVRVVVSSQQATVAHLLLYRDQTLIGERDIELRPGKNAQVFSDILEDPGLHRYEAVVNVVGDPLTENNRNIVFTDVVGKTKVLIVYGEEGPPTQLAQSLTVQGLAPELRRWTELPHALSELLQYDAVILDNAPGLGVSLAKMEAIEKYVRDSGGGLVMLGGDRSFGPGGYYRTPVERALPVNMDVPAKMTIPSLALMLVIDKSDSMGGYIGDASRGGRPMQGTTKLELAKMASFSAITLLNPFDQVGLVGFNTDTEWVIPLTEAGDRERIGAKLSGLNHSGGTDVYKGLVEGFQALSQVKAIKKHLILLSDGLTPKADFEGLVRQMAQHRVTVSTVALGEDADKWLMSQVAEWGQGRYYFANDAESVPRIFTSETILVARTLVEEHTFVPSVRQDHEVLRGIELNAVPPLRGYVLAYPKPAAEVLLISDKADPVLAVWRYGLGRTVAFTSDLRGRWGKAWVEWEDFGKFASQVVRWTQRKTLRQNMWMNVALQDDKSQITVDLYDDQNEFINNATLTGTVTVSEKASTPLPFEQTAPGRYKGSFGLNGTGEYFITISGQDGRGETIEPRTTAFAIPYSAEYIPRPQNLRLLRKLVDLTGGQALHMTDKSETLTELFQVAGDGHRPPYSLWYLLVLAALVLYFLDIVARKLPPAEQWLGRFGWRLPQRPRTAMARTGSADGAEAAPSRPGETAGGGGMPSGELYVARLRRRASPSDSSRTVWR